MWARQRDCVFPPSTLASHPRSMPSYNRYPRTGWSIRRHNSLIIEPCCKSPTICRPRYRCSNFIRGCRSRPSSARAIAHSLITCLGHFWIRPGVLSLKIDSTTRPGSYGWYRRQVQSPSSGARNPNLRVMSSNAFKAKAGFAYFSRRGLIASCSSTTDMGSVTHHLVDGCTASCRSTLPRL